MTETMTVRKQWGLYTVLILAGILGNYFKYPLFLSIDFLFGSIFAFLALQFFGLKWGLLASSLIASVTYLHWGHPYAIVIFTSEILIAALLLRKIKINVILSDAIYWLFVGLPMVYFFYNQIMGISLDSVYVVMAKQAVNGISNVLIARVIYLIYAYLSRRNTASFREVIYYSLIFCLAAPMLLFLSIESRTDLNKLEDDVQQVLIDERRNMEQLLSVWVSGRLDSSSQLALLANSLPIEQLQSRLEQALGFDQNFASFGFINKQGKSVYFAPKGDKKGVSNIGRDFSEQIDFSAASDSSPFFTRVLTDLNDTTNPAVAIILPLRINAVFDGYIVGFLKAGQIQLFLNSAVRGEASHYMLLDENSNVMLTNDPNQPLLANFKRGEGELLVINDEVSKWFPSDSYQLAINRTTSSYYMTTAQLGGPTNWTLELQQSVEPIQQALNESSTKRLVLLLKLLLIGTVIAELLSRQIAKANEQLLELTYDLPVKLASNEVIVWPESSSEEIHHLIGNFKSMADSLKKKFFEIKMLNQSLELKVKARTQELNTINKNLVATQKELSIAASAFESQEGIYVTDENQIILRVNTAFSEITGYTHADVFGRTPQLFESEHHDSKYYSEMRASIAEIGRWQGEIVNRHKSGKLQPLLMSITCIRNTDGDITNYVCNIADISRRKEAEEEIRNLAFFDSLTQLPNRRLLMDRLKHALLSYKRSGRIGAVLFIDLDDFKSLNDTLGHALGDKLLCQVAERLTSCVREGDTVARIGGDEFVVLIENLSENGELAAELTKRVAEKIIKLLNEPYLLMGVLHHSTPSIGVSIFDKNSTTMDELLRHADLAMYQAKAAGRNTLRFFDPEMHAVLSTRTALESDLRIAIEQEQFFLCYQPQVHVDGKVQGVEALVRWNHPTQGLLSPASFISLAEGNQMIVPLGILILKIACKQLMAWSSIPERRDLTISVNVSTMQFRQLDFVSQVLRVLEKTGAPANRLKIEITESLLMQDSDQMSQKMMLLKNHGVRFSLDDFGTGFSSLSYLKRLPIDQLKIDQTFVRDVFTDVHDAAIVKTIIALGRSLSFEVIAEGVETVEQKNYLTQQGCSYFQGYFFSRPLSIEALEQYIDNMTAKKCG
ncbi:EAL domain-containing protein [Brumicola nitratireducens]|uniref:cyclic-guanylate-specific phosphodiesterase n=1 Tax=Glaciecola nitratireducens (strain JCM 12485 / KCTC 12276 / FR1064) TaxID=1085623 RepID=G4QFX4_GLANF|nr:EAL domain-containing protein [Glaciecola nitratireducens]AEP29065.1 putative signaling protein PA1727 [Glaciecola nitratireducens FR1064]